MLMQHEFIKLCLENFREVEAHLKDKGEAIMRMGYNGPPKTSFLVYNSDNLEPDDGLVSLKQPLVSLTEKEFHKEFSDITDKVFGCRSASWLTTEVGNIAPDKVSYFVSGLTLVMIKDNIHCLLRVG